MIVITKVQKIVREALKERFPKIKIIAINVEEDEDYDGNEILRINVIFRAKEGDFDPARMHELPRLVMPKLKDAVETRGTGFPLFSFIAESELGKLKAERA
ncbi:MAG TPA: hypothetical protein VHC39_03440 [Rhizomicrobium sp.]|nr:hypothetical protein [Rhizomicrobium sp.]